MSQKSIIEVLDEHVSELMALEGVEGVGQGEFNGSPCITVFVSVPKEQMLSLIPDFIEGYKVVVKESGTFSPL